MKFLNAECVRTILSPGELMNVIEEAYEIYDQKKCYIPPRPTVEYSGKTLMYMPCFTERYVGTKVLSIFPENSARGLPVIDGLMLLNNYETGEPAALLDGKMLTAMRTGAVGGVAMRYLSPKSASRVGLIGTGTQGFYQLLYACTAREIRSIFLYQRNNKDLTSFVRRLRDILGNEVPIETCSRVDEVVRNSEIVITATNSQEAVLPDDAQLLEGRCYIAIGSYKPVMRELPNALWKVCPQVYTELPFAMEESGDLSQPLREGLLTEKQVILMSDYLKRKGAVNQTVCFKSVGMGLFDLMVAEKMVQAAEQKGAGQDIDL